jgi:hypothetical protein
VSKPLWCALCLIAGLAALVWARSVESVCIATNPLSGQRVVIGTERTEAALQNLPGATDSELLESLADAPPETAWTPASIARCHARLTLSRAAWVAAFVLAAVFAAVARKPSTTPLRPKPGTVFLSYNHADAVTAARLRSALQSHHIPVLIDSENMAPGERIDAFIERSLRDSAVVVSIVSTSSLLSAWVALETIQTLNRNRWLDPQKPGGRKFIACYLDDAFFDPECRLHLTRQIDDRLGRIEELLPDYAARRLDTRDLDEEKSRLYDLRNHLGVILDTLKSTLCLDLRDPHFDESVRRLIATIRP